MLTSKNYKSQIPYNSLQFTSLTHIVVGAFTICVVQSLFITALYSLLYFQ